LIELDENSRRDDQCFTSLRKKPLCRSMVDIVPVHKGVERTGIYYYQGLGGEASFSCSSSSTRRAVSNGGSVEAK
jgi:hypothetical protein